MGNSLPDISSIATCFASSFSVRVLESESVVMPVVFATAAAWVSVSAAEGAEDMMFAYEYRVGDRWVDVLLLVAGRSRREVMRRCMSCFSQMSRFVSQSFFPNVSNLFVPRFPEAR